MPSTSEVQSPPPHPGLVNRRAWVDVALAVMVKEYWVQDEVRVAMDHTCFPPRDMTKPVDGYGGTYVVGLYRAQKVSE